MKKNFGLFLALMTAGTVMAADPAAQPSAQPPLAPPPNAGTNQTAPTTPVIADPAPITNSVATSTNKTTVKKDAKDTAAKKDTTKKPAAKKPAKVADVPLASPLVLNEQASTVHSNV